MEVRVRYAPSPTGLQHIGSVRTALINYLFARSAGGTFILRLEDTDRTRSDDTFVQNIHETFKWLGFYWDEGPDVGGPYGPYVQSERLDLYREHAEKLVGMGKAYYCFCDEERLSRMHTNSNDAQSFGAADCQDVQDAASQSFGYDRLCRNLDPAQARTRAAQGEPHVIRLKIPLEGSTKFDDLLLGEIQWRNVDVNPDPVLLKSDGFPTYHLANVVDDHAMKITHVMRAQEWISSAPLHVIMYDAFGWTMPAICHLPMVLGEDGHKLSKRHGATAVNEFRLNGYLKEALINYIAMLGCSYEDGRDMYPLPDLEKLFSIQHLNKAPAIFDYKKLEWFNGQYIRAKADDELYSMLLPYAVAAGLVTDPPSKEGERLLRGSIPLVKERLRFLTEIGEMASYLFRDPSVPPVSEIIPKKLDAQGTKRVLVAAKELLSAVNLDDIEGAEHLFRDKAAELGVKLGDLLMPLRIAVTGSRVSPPLFESMRLLGAQAVRGRVDRVVSAL